MAKHLQTGSLKTINGQTLEGSGDIVISGSGGGTGLSELPAYSTNEVLTSRRWVNGKPIYRKTYMMEVIGNGLPDNLLLEQLTDLDEPAGDFIYQAYPDANDPSTGYWYDARYMQQSTNFVYVFINTDKDLYIGISNWAGTFTRVYYTFEYTKLSDTTLSPVALIGGGSGSTENITTDVEYIVPQIIDGKQVYGMRINCGALPNATIKTIDIPSYATSYTYWFKEGFALDPTTGDTRILPFVHYSTTTNQVSLFLDQGTSNAVGTVQIVTSIDYSSWDGIITLHYTK